MKHIFFFTRTAILRSLLLLFLMGAMIETVMGDEFEEFYPDEDALYEMILDIFYEPVEQ